MKVMVDNKKLYCRGGDYYSFTGEDYFVNCKMKCIFSFGKVPSKSGINVQ